MKSNVLKKPEVTRSQIVHLQSMRDAMDSMRKRYELLENAVKAGEQSIITALEEGASMPEGMELHIRQVERRYPSWKSHFVALAGAEAAERVLAETAPTTYKMLIVR